MYVEFLYLQIYTCICCYMFIKSRTAALWTHPEAQWSSIVPVASAFITAALGCVRQLSQGCAWCMTALTVTFAGSGERWPVVFFSQHTVKIYGRDVGYFLSGVPAWPLRTADEAFFWYRQTDPRATEVQYQIKQFKGNGGDDLRETKRSMEVSRKEECLPIRPHKEQGCRLLCFAAERKGISAFNRL